MEYNIIWRLSGENPLYLLSGNDWTDNPMLAKRFSDLQVAKNRAEVIGHDARVCLAL